jgi:hypothetical protein
MMSTPTFKYSAASRGVIQLVFLDVGSAGFIAPLLTRTVRLKALRVCRNANTIGGKR